MKGLARTSVFLAAATALLVLATACSDTNTQGVKATATSEVSTENRDQFINEAQSQIDKLEQRVSDLKKEAQNQADAQNADQKVNDLQHQIDDLKGKVQQARNSNGDDFNKLKSDINARLNNAQSDAKDLADRLGL